MSKTLQTNLIGQTVCLTIGSNQSAEELREQRDLFLKHSGGSAGVFQRRLGDLAVIRAAHPAGGELQLTIEFFEDGVLLDVPAKYVRVAHNG